MASETENTIKEILDDLIPAMEAVEAQSTAVLRFLEENGITSDEQLQPYLQQGADASNVKWRAVRVRMERLLNSAMEAVQKASEKKTKPSEPQTTDDKTTEQETAETAKSPSQDAGSSDKKYVGAATEEKTTKDKSPATEARREAPSDEAEKKEAA